MKNYTGSVFALLVALVLIIDDRELEMLGRYGENAYLWRMMKVAKHKSTELYELQGFDHGGMAAPAHGILLKHINSKAKLKRNSTEK
jgi:hypothetical protein